MADERKKKQITTQDDEYYFSRLRALSRYLIILIEEYPRPITQSELAVKAGVSKAAVNKIKNLLLRLCDKNVLAYHSNKMVLRPEKDVYDMLFPVFLIKLEFDNFGKFLGSKYYKDVLQNTNFFGSLLDSIDKDRIYFEVRDLEQILLVISENLKKSNVEFEKKNGLKVLSQYPRKAQGNVYAIILSNYFQRIMQDFELCIKTEKDLLFFLGLRDKSYHMIHDFINGSIIPHLEIFTEIKENETKKMFEDVYQKTAEFYLKKGFQEVTNKIRDSTADVEFIPSYSEVGSTFPIK